LYAVFTLFLLLAPGIIIAGCDLLNTSLAEYFLDHNEIVQVTGLTVKTDHVMTADGRILIPPGEARIGVGLSNPRNFMVKQELLDAPATIAARQISQTELEVHIREAKVGDEYALTLALQSPDGLRDFPSYPLRIQCVSFETALRDFTVNGATPPAFDPAQDAFRVTVPYSNATVALKGTAAHTEALVELYAGADDSGALLAMELHAAETTRNLAVGENSFYVRVTAQSLTTRGYAVTVYRSAASEIAITDFYFALGSRRYGVGTGVVPASGSIEGTAITVTVPYGTDLTNRGATAAYAGDSIAPDPALPRSYVDPVDYAVRAAEGMPETYTVRVNTAKIARLETISFVDGFTHTGSDISGDIKAAITSVTGTDSLGTAVTLAREDYSVDALFPTDADEGNAMTATLRVPAAKGSTGDDIAKGFAVYIKNGAKAIRAFRIASPASATGSIDEGLKTITATVPYGTDVTNMTVSASHTGAAISPDPASPRSYADPVVYTVTAEDGTTAAYTVTVKTAPNSAKELRAFSIASPASAAGTIDEALKTITATVPHGTDVTAMTASASHTGAAISPDPASPRSYATPVRYTVTAEDGTTAVYTVTVKAEPNSAKELTAFSIASPVSATGSISGNNITVTVPYGTDVTNMTASASHTGAAISPDPASPRSYATPVRYTVTAEDGTTAVYTVTVKAEPNSAKAITAFRIVSPANAAGTIDEALKTITVTVPYGTGVAAMTASASHTGATISPDPASPRSYAGPVRYTVSAEDGTTATYTVTVTAALNPAKAITAFSIASPVSATGSISGNNITVTVPYGTGVAAMTASASHTGAAISPDPASPRSYAGPISYTVTAEDGTTAIYTVTVKAEPGITISVTPVAGLNVLAFSLSQAAARPGDLIAITITGGSVTSWHIDLNGPVTPTDFSTDTVTFAAPTAQGFYNVNVIARAGGIDYSGSFGLVVD
jgi:hypothetical protein